MSENTDMNSPKGETNRIDLTQLEEIIEDAKAYMESWFKGTVVPFNGEEWRDIRDLGLHVDWSHNEVFAPLVEEFPTLIAELKRCYDLIDSLQNEMYGFKEALWAEALCDESENVVGVEAYPGDQKREKKVFFISCDLVDEMYVFFQQHGKLDLSKNASK